MDKQISSDHYRFETYMSRPRWGSLHACLDQISKLDELDSILELGPGSGILGAILKHQGYKYVSCDIADDVGATYVGDFTKLVARLPKVDCVVACQVLEHMPYSKSMEYISAMASFSSRYIVISVPNLETVYQVHVTLPRRKELIIGLRKPIFRRKRFKFNGQHYWELGCKEVPVNRFLSDLGAIDGWMLIQSFRVSANPYHHFFVLERVI